MRKLLIALVAALVTPASVGAQCAFDRPNGSTGYIGSYTSSLVRAFVSCNNPGGNTPNTTISGGTIPGCSPAEDFGQNTGLPPSGWNFSNGLASSSGKVQIKRTSGGVNLNLPPTLRDTVVKVKLYRIAKNSGGYASGTGNVQVYLRVTTQDYLGDDMTVIDFPFAFPITLSSYGTGSVTKKVGDLLMQHLSQPRWSDCTSVEILSVSVRDPTGNLFAVSGVRF